MESKTILIVEDDADISELLAIAFAKEGWGATRAQTGENALALLKGGNFSACVLDLMLPGIDGLAVLRAMRKLPESARIPVIIASARGEDADIVAGLELGADDYIAKPFSPKVLVARIHALLRRASGDSVSEPGSAKGFLEGSGISLDTIRHEVRVSGNNVLLSATEFSLLELLMREPGRVYTRSQAISATKGDDYPVTDRSVDVHILSMRRKLGEPGTAIETVRGIGYRFRGEP
jgi:two-component system phosphate regulon response regulator PhoB